MTDVDRSDIERHWLVTYSCGHEEEVVTFIGDFDYVAAHRDVPDICRLCRLDPKKSSPIVKVVKAESLEGEFAGDELERRRRRRRPNWWAR